MHQREHVEMIPVDPVEVIPLDPSVRRLLARHHLAREMIYYFANGEPFGPEATDRDVILPVGMELPEGLPARALFAVSPLEFWCLELAHVMMDLGKVSVPPLLLPEHTDGVVLLPESISSLPSPLP